MYRLYDMVRQPICFGSKLEHLMVEYQENDMFVYCQYRGDHENQEVIQSNEQYPNQ
jgi:hypothetical protein